MDNRIIYDPISRFIGGEMIKGLKETSKKGALLWLFQRFSAVILFIMVLFHFVVYHFITKDAVTYDQVVLKMKSPWFNLLQFLFLISALYHGLNGVWMVVEDYIQHKLWRMLLFTIIVTAGMAFLFVGTLTIFKIAGI